MLLATVQTQGPFSCPPPSGGGEIQPTRKLQKLLFRAGSGNETSKLLAIVIAVLFFGQCEKRMGLRTIVKTTLEFFK